jgi:hypothetical protein
MLIRMAIAALFALGLFAQGSGSSYPAPEPAGPIAFPERPFEVYKSSTGTFVAIEDGVLVVDDQRIKEPRKLKLMNAAKIRVTADKKSELGNRKKLTLADLGAGMYVRVTYQAETNAVIEIRVLKPKDA